MEAALKTDLLGIKVANGFQTDLARVYTRPVAAAAVITPAVSYTPAGGGRTGSAELLTIGDGVSEAVEAWRLELLSQSRTPREDLQRFKDDVRNALERPTSALRAVAGVARVDVTEWNEPVVSESQDAKQQFGLLVLSAEVVYTYSKGGL